MLHESENISYKADHVFHWASQCIEALSYIHWKGFAHGDLKTAKYDFFFICQVFQRVALLCLLLGFSPLK